MKAILMFLLGVSSLLAVESQPLPPPAKITGVGPGSEQKVLLIRYEISGAGYEERFAFPEEISDFRYCPWPGTLGVALVARTGEGKTSKYFYAAFYLGTKPHGSHQAVQIPAPAEEFKVLGIGNPGGDSLVIQASDQSRLPTEVVSGWVYTDNCPLTDFTAPYLLRGVVTKFEIPINYPAPAK